MKNINSIFIVQHPIMETAKKIETKTANIWIDHEGFLHLKLKEGAEIDLEEVEIHFDIYRKLGCQKHKALHLFEGGTFFTFDSKAMKYVTRHGHDYFIASAVVNNSIAIRLLFNFFNKFFNNSTDKAFQFKMFNTRGQALEWLRSFKEEKKP